MPSRNPPRADGEPLRAALRSRPSRLSLQPRLVRQPGFDAENGPGPALVGPGPFHWCARELPSGSAVCAEERRATMPQGDKSAYTNKQKRKAEHIAEGYEDSGVGKKEAKSRAWATVNKESGCGNKSGSGRGRKDSNVSSKRGGKKGGAVSANRSAASRSAAAKKGWETRRRRGTA